MPIHCSYCHQSGHNISRCNDPNIPVICNRLKSLYLNIKRQTQDSQVGKNQFIEQAGRLFMVRELTAVCSRYGGRNVGVSKRLLAYKMWDLYDETINVNIQDTNPIITVESFIPMVADPIPHYAQDILDPLDNDHIPWSLDRTPSTIPQIVEVGAPIRNITRTNNYGIMALSLVASVLSARNDDFIPFNPRNLNEEFNQAAMKKYNIVPIMSTELDEVLELEEDSEIQHNCPICYEETNPSNLVTTNCGHGFCGECIKQTLVSYNNKHTNPCCALCRTEMRYLTVKHVELFNSVSEHCNV